ncbi:MAG: lipopolysaccharide biosynthesis protein [Planctomycetaceae bacterium]|nr:lipopolysaccharide biosynthesis protein [Planctomycetaceae bacterium]
MNPTGPDHKTDGDSDNESNNPCQPAQESAPQAAGWLSRLLPGRFGKNVISNAGGNALHSAMQLGLLLVLIRILDDRSYAAFLLATFLVGLLEMASDYGTRIWATREFSFVKSGRPILRRSCQSKLFYTILSGAAAACLPLNTLDTTAFVICLLIAATQPSTDPLLWYLRGRERLDVEAGVVLAFRTLVTLGMLTVAWLGGSLYLMLLIWLTGNVARIMTESRLSMTADLFVPPDPDSTNVSPRLSATLTYVFPIGTAFVLTALFQRATVFLLDIFATPQDIKFYGTAFKVVSTSGFVATSIFVSSFPRLAKAIASDDRPLIRTVISRMLTLVTAVFAPICVVGILATVPLSRLTPIDDVLPIARITVLLMPGLYLSCINMGLKYTLNAFELNWQDVCAVVVGMMVLTLATVFHGRFSWAEAAAIGWAAGEGTLLACRMLLLWKHKRHAGVPLSLILTATSALVLMIGLTWTPAAALTARSVGAQTRLVDDPTARGPSSDSLRAATPSTTVTN